MEIKCRRRSSPLRLTRVRVAMQDLDKTVEDALACPCVADMKEVSALKPIP